MVGFLARTVDDGEVDLLPDGDEIREARWWTRDALREAAGTDLLLPGRTSIARAIIEHWYGGRLEGDW
jgi:NAD+ diphosphatase